MSTDQEKAIDDSLLEAIEDESKTSDKIKITTKTETPASSSPKSLEDRLALRAKRFGASDKLKERALRFGTLDKADQPSDDALKKRAARFGLSDEKSGETGSKGSQSSEVLKKRAQRFGAISDSVKQLETEEKLTKRQKRFGSLKV